MDDDTYLDPALPAAEALSRMKAHFLRYPGGEKSDTYLWSSAPWTSSEPDLARKGINEWPSNDPRFSDPFGSLRPHILDFDEFMTLCQSVDCEPLITVPYDSMYVPATAGGTVPTREQLLESARQWVWYANTFKNYGVKYWMIGNESYHSFSGETPVTAAQYRDDLIDFAQQMKSQDPSIRIVANGLSDSWWQTVLPLAAQYIDHLGVSNYPVWNWNGYNEYATTNKDLMEPVDRAFEAIELYAPTSERDRLTVITTEYNSVDWAGTWPDANDLGHALVAFEIAGEHLNREKIEFAQFWTTRWIDNDTNPLGIFSALNRDGGRNAMATSVAIWGNFMLDEMVAAAGTIQVRAFASHDSSSGRVNLFLINKHSSARVADITLEDYAGGSSWRRWELSGSGPDDTSPSWGVIDVGPIPGSTLSLTLPAVSLTVLELGIGAQPDDTDGDWISDLEDCAPLDETTWEAPEEPYIRSMIPTVAGGLAIEWQDMRVAAGSSTTFRLAGGDLASLRASGSFLPSATVCKQNEPLHEDAASPVNRWYLVGADSVCGSSGFGLGYGSGRAALEQEAPVTCP